MTGWDGWMALPMDMSLSKLQETVKDREPGVLWYTESQSVRLNLATEQESPASVYVQVPT